MPDATLWASVSRILSLRGISATRAFALWRRAAPNTPRTGVFELRKQISLYMNRRFRLSYDPLSQIIVTVGGSEA